MTLVIGFGNPGRGDDGLGPEFVHRLDAHAVPGVSTITDFQLKVEHAVRIAEAERVVFVDAAIGQDAPYVFAPLAPAAHGDVTSHAVAPDVVLALAQMHFGARAPGYLMAISGEEFDLLRDGLSPIATRNLAQAERCFLGWLADLSEADRAAP